MPESNFISHLVGFRDPTLLRGSWWPSGQNLTNAVINIRCVKQSLDNGAKLAVAQPNRRHKIDDKNVFNWSALMVKNLVKILTRISSVSNLKLYIKNKLLYRYILNLTVCSQQLQSYFEEQLLLPICTQRKTEITRNNLKATNSPFFFTIQDPFEKIKEIYKN